MFPSWGGEMICVLESVLHWLLSNWCSSPIHPSTRCFRMIVLALCKSHSFASWSVKGRFCVRFCQEVCKGKQANCRKEGNSLLSACFIFLSESPYPPHLGFLALRSPASSGSLAGTNPFQEAPLPLSLSLPFQDLSCEHIASAFASLTFLFLPRSGRSFCSYCSGHSFCFYQSSNTFSFNNLQCSIWKSLMAFVVLTGHWHKHFPVD